MKKKQERRLMWAFGSNLNVKRMWERCPQAIPFSADKRNRPTAKSKLYVPNATLVFRGVADVEYTDGGAVPGGLWWITPSCECKLDGFEGAGHFYNKKYLTVRLSTGEIKRVLYYQIGNEGIQPPTQYYLDLIEQGYKDFGLDLAYLNEAVEHSWSNKRKTPLLARRWENKGKPKLARPHLAREAAQ